MCPQAGREASLTIYVCAYSYICLLLLYMCPQVDLVDLQVDLQVAVLRSEDTYSSTSV
jgi:hypothetical protein